MNNKELQLDLIRQIVVCEDIELLQAMHTMISRLSTSTPDVPPLIEESTSIPTFLHMQDTNNRATATNDHDIEELQRTINDIFNP